MQTANQFSSQHIQRPGLLWLSANPANKTIMVYMAFSMADGASEDPNEYFPCIVDGIGCMKT